MAGQGCPASCLVHMLNVCLEPHCHQVLPTNAMTMSNMGHPQIGTHMDGAMVDGSWLWARLHGKKAEAPGSTVRMLIEVLRH